MMTDFPIKTPVMRRFGLSHPIFGFSHSPQAVAALTNSGGFGVYGATRRFGHEIREELAWIRSQVGDRPFGVDLVVPANMPANNDPETVKATLPEGHKAFVRKIAEKYNVPASDRPGMRTRFLRSQEILDAQVAAVADAEVDLVALGIGSPPDLVRRLKEGGKTTLALVGQEKHAVRALEAGVDLLVAQGYDAGAHTGPIGTFSLVPQICRVAGDVPVLAAGGVATGAHLAAALALGAQATWIGTAFLLTHENLPHMSRTQAEALMASGFSDTVVTRADSGKTFRQIRSAWSDEWAAPDAPSPLGHPEQDMLVGDLLGAIIEHEIRPLAHIGAGQGVGWFSQVRSVAEVVNKFSGDAAAIITGLSANLPERGTVGQ